MNTEEHTKLYAEFQLRLNSILCYTIDREEKHQDLILAIANMIEYVNKDESMRVAFMVWIINLYSQMYLSNIDNDTALELLMQSSMHSMQAACTDV